MELPGVYTAVYRLWEIGYLTSERSDGQSLGKEPWWVVVAAVTYSGERMVQRAATRGDCNGCYLRVMLVWSSGAIAYSGSHRYSAYV
jgi:hypothetical protein